MVKLKKEKILVSLVVMVLVACVFGNIASLATAPIIANTASGNTVGAANNTTNNTANNAANVGSISATVGSGNNTANNTNSNTNRTSNNSTNNTSTNSSRLPYAGTDSSVVFIVIALVASALYAYKKVSDYNV